MCIIQATIVLLKLFTRTIINHCKKYLIPNFIPTQYFALKPEKLRILRRFRF